MSRNAQQVYDSTNADSVVTSRFLGKQMLNLMIASPDSPLITWISERLSTSAECAIVETCSLGSEMSQILRRTALDAILFPPDWMEMCRTVRNMNRHQFATDPAFIVVGESQSNALSVKASLYGFDGFITARGAHDDVNDDIARIVSRPGASLNEAVAAQALMPGLLARQIVVDNSTDAEIAALVGMALPDRIIADLAGLPIQQVRNRIEFLLRSNGLTYRTQLAVLMSTLWRVPDFG